MAIHQRLKNWFRQKSRSRKNGQEETVAVPEVHTGKVRHEAADSTPEADCPIHSPTVFPIQASGMEISKMPCSSSSST